MTHANQPTKTHDACPLCEGTLRPRYDGIRDRLGTSSVHYRLDECAGCGLGLINPAPTGDLSAFYPDHYLSSEDEGDAEGAADLISRCERAYRYDQYRFDFALLQRSTGLRIGESASYVDIGCGSGERVAYVAEQGCSRAVGVDRYQFGKAAARTRYRLINCEITDFAPEERFDVVSLFHVLEHVEDPLGLLAHLRHSVVAEHGVLVLQVPNYAARERRVFGRRWFGLDAPRHLFQFTSATVVTTLEKAGFEVVDVSRVNAPLHPVTVVPSMFPALDPQRIWVRPGSRYAKALWLALWAAATVAAIPVSWLQNLTRNASMLTVVARPPS